MRIVTVVIDAGLRCRSEAGVIYVVCTLRVWQKRQTVSIFFESTRVCLSFTPMVFSACASVDVTRGVGSVFRHSSETDQISVLVSS